MQRTEPELERSATELLNLADVRKSMLHSNDL
jgi:hypothetical protein